MPSATTAESRLSTAASSATVSAEGSSGMIRSAGMSGIASCGKPCWNSAKFAADGFNGKPEQRDGSRASQQRDDRAGNSLHKARQQKDDGERCRWKRPVSAS